MSRCSMSFKSEYIPSFSEAKKKANTICSFTGIVLVSIIIHTFT